MKLHLEQKTLNLGPKMPDLGNFTAGFEKIIVIFEINKFIKK